MAYGEMKRSVKKAAVEVGTAAVKRCVKKRKALSKLPHGRCCFRGIVKPRMRIRSVKTVRNFDSEEPLVLPSLTVDGKMPVAYSKIRQTTFDEGSISRLTLAGRVEHVRSFYQSKLTQFW